MNNEKKNPLEAPSSPACERETVIPTEKKPWKERLKEALTWKNIVAWGKANVTTIIPFVGFALCILVFSIVPPLATGKTIWTKFFWKSFVERSITLMIISLGAIFIYSMGAMDISVGASAGVAAIIMTLVSNATGHLWVGVFVALAFTIVCAVINASVGEFLHLPAVIGSIFLMFFAGGIQAIYFTGTEAVTLYGDFSFLKQTWFQITFLVVFACVTLYLFKFTRLGKYTRAIGTNETVARQSGVNTWLFKFFAYSFLGLAIVFACVNSVNRVGTVTKSTGANFHMSIMIALILGGMPVSGGMKSRVSSAVVGTMIYNILETGLILSGVPASATMLVQSIILFAIIVLTCRRKDIKTLQR